MHEPQAHTLKNLVLGLPPGPLLLCTLNGMHQLCVPVDEHSVNCVDPNQAALRASSARFTRIFSIMVADLELLTTYRCSVTASNTAGSSIAATTWVLSGVRRR
jgi:hypothetical protein